MNQLLVFRGLRLKGLFHVAQVILLLEEIRQIHQLVVENPMIYHGVFYILAPSQVGLYRRISGFINVVAMIFPLRGLETRGVRLEQQLADGRTAAEAVARWIQVGVCWLWGEKSFARVDEISN